MEQRSAGLEEHKPSQEWDLKGALRATHTKSRERGTGIHLIAFQDNGKSQEQQIADAQQCRSGEQLKRNPEAFGSW